jgi:hypothetical protein
MQQLYGCWSWWLAHPHKRPVLVMTPFSSVSPFVEGIFTVLQHAVNVTLVDPANYTDPTVSVRFEPRRPILRDPSVPFYAMHSPQDARDLAVTTFQYLNHTPLAGCSLQQQQQMDTLYPRMAILNRLQQRSLLNAKDLAAGLSTLYPDNRTIPVVTLEGANFSTQVQFFGDYDLIFTPHGAQMTGLAFLPHCGGIVEAFPLAYFWPEFFGSLARAAGKAHGYVYLSDGDARYESAYGMDSQIHSRKYRGISLCPNVTTVVAAMREMIEEWRSCCVQQQQQHSVTTSIAR